MRIGIVFPGQGSQSAGMGRALHDALPECREVFEAADAALGEPLSRLIFEGPDEDLALTANTQPAILTVSVAAWRALSRRGVEPSFVAGHSLGEYSALVAAGALSFPDAVRLVRRRGTYMQQAVPQGVGAMAAIIGLAAEAVAEACAEAADGEIVSVANLNSPEQTVIAGHAGAVRRASEACLKKGARRALPLPVSAPFHCALMDPARQRLATDIARAPMRNARCPVVTNADATPASIASDLADALVRQVTSPVRWVETVRRLAFEGTDLLIEAGPGRVLSGLVRRTSPEMKCAAVESPETLEAALAAAGVN